MREGRSSSVCLRMEGRKDLPWLSLGSERDLGGGGSLRDLTGPGSMGILAALQALNLEPPA